MSEYGTWQVGDAQEPRLTKREVRCIAQQEALAAKQQQQERRFFGKTRIRDYSKFVKLNYPVFYDTLDAA